MTNGLRTPSLTQLEFSDRDHKIAERIARRLGYLQTAYTSTSALWGLFCLPENPRTAKPGEATQGGCIIKTRELGFLFVQDTEGHRIRSDQMTLQEWREAYPGISLVTPDPQWPMVYMITDRALPGQTLRELATVTDYAITCDMLKAHYGPTVWIAPRVDRDDWTRTEYMAHAIDHQTYYLSLARAIGYKGLSCMVLNIAPLDQLIACVDDLNRIPLARWDGYGDAVRAMVSEVNHSRNIMARSWCGQPLPPHTICWSLSESVCVLKAVARELARTAGAVIREPWEA